MRIGWGGRAGAALVFVAALASAGAAFAQSKWTRWVGWKFGTTIAYPADLFSPLPEPDAHDGRTFVARDGARIAAFGEFAGFRTIGQIHAARVSGPDYGQVTYRARGKTWSVASGLRDREGGREVFYERSVVQPDGQAIHTVVIAYPESAHAIYDRLVARIVAPLDASRYAPPR